MIHVRFFSKRQREHNEMKMLAKRRQPPQAKQAFKWFSRCLLKLMDDINLNSFSVRFATRPASSFFVIPGFVIRNIKNNRALVTVKE